MRYDTPIYFQREPEKTYDPLTGNYVKDEPVEVKRYANVTDASSVSKLFEFGKEYEQGLVVRIQGRYQEPISFIRLHYLPFSSLIITKERRAITCKSHNECCYRCA